MRSRASACAAAAYGPVRLWGSVAFIVRTSRADCCSTVLAPANLIWLIWRRQLRGRACRARGWCRCRATSARARRAAPATATCASRHFLAIAAAASLIQASHAVYYGFATLDWTAAGFDGVTIGVLWALGVVGRDRAVRVRGAAAGRIGPVTLIVIGAGGAVLRWTLMALDPPVAVLILLQLLHGALVRRDASSAR